MRVVLHLNAYAFTHEPPSGVLDTYRVGRIASIYRCRDRTVIVLLEQKDSKQLRSDLQSCILEGGIDPAIMPFVMHDIIIRHYDVDGLTVMMQILDDPSALSLLQDVDTVEVWSECPFVYAMLLTMHYTNKPSQINVCPIVNYMRLDREFVCPLSQKLKRECFLEYLIDGTVRDDTTQIELPIPSVDELMEYSPRLIRKPVTVVT